MNFNGLRNGGVALCFLALLALIAMKIEADAAKSFTGPYRVGDGDSLARGKTRLRLLGIDAPELHQSCLRQNIAWKCGEASRQMLASLVEGKPVQCRGSREDKYKRLLVTCRNGDQNINREMIRRGMAVSYGDYEAEEKQARAERVGLWASDFAKPVDWRRSHNAGMDDEDAHVPSFFRRLFGME